MKVSDGVIKLHRKESNWWSETPWEMTVNLSQVTRWTGEKGEDNCVEYPVPKASKLIDIIIKNGDPEDLAECEKYFQKNKKLYRRWKKRLEKAGCAVPSDLND